MAGSTQRPKEYFFGATGGGVWKTSDGGASWSAVSDGFFGTGSVGALAVAPSNPDVVLAGTGERDIRGNISHGDGLYRSDDAGKTWRHLGLKSTQTISRIVIHPTNPNIIYVAALGHVYGPSLDRGVYKSTDGGVSWNLVLPGADRAGAVDLSIDPKNPETLIASIWDAWRTPYTMNSGGPNSRLLRTTNGGISWSEISRNPGMPKGMLGKIGVSISPVDSNRYWAIVEAADGGIFRSDDAGATWQLTNDSRNWRQRAWYYTHIYADTKDKEVVYVLNVGWGRSTDGGKTFTGLPSAHSDHHDLWIASEDPNRMILANDGGACISTDGFKTFTEQNYPTAQFYHVSTDNAFPYRILGAQQDNSTVRIASRTQGGGIGPNDWSGTAGGESGYVAAKPDDPDVVFGGSYGGDLSMLNHRTNQSRAVDPWPDNPMGHGAVDLDQRFQWTYPIVFSPHDPNTLYTCSQFVLKTVNGGKTWKKISPDLTRNDPTTMGPSGGPITKDNTSVEYYGTVFTVAESPRKRGVIWAGSDDGLIHVTRDGGKSWTNVTPKQMPKWGLVSMIDASPSDPAVAYAAIDNHENDDYAPYALVTRDYGKTWKTINTGLPTDSFVRVVREDHRSRTLLYAGTETGIWVSFDAGSHWQSLGLNLPVTPVHDLALKEDDLIVATHGRSFWVLDDISPLQQIAKATPTKNTLFAPRDAYRVRWGGGGRGRGTIAGPVGENPPSGVILNYYLPSDAKEVTYELSDAKGEIVGRGSASSKAGFQRTSGWMQYPGYRGFPGMILWGGFGGPIPAPPGPYTATIIVDGQRLSQTFRWKADPRSPATEKELQEQTRFAREIAARVTLANDTVSQIRKFRSDIAPSLAKGVPLPKSIEMLKGLTEVEEAIYQTKNKSGQDPLNYPIRLNDKIAALLGNVLSGNFGPTDQSYEVYRKLSGQLEVQLQRFTKLIGPDLVAANAELKAAGLATISVPTPGVGQVPAPPGERELEEANERDGRDGAN